MNVLKKEDLNFRQLFSSKTSQEYSLSALVSPELHSSDFFIHQEVISPQHQSSAPHRHGQTDEFLFVIEGEVVLLEGEEERTLQKGDFALFHKGSRFCHVVKNKSKINAEILIIKKKLQQNDVLFS